MHKPEQSESAGQVSLQVCTRTGPNRAAEEWTSSGVLPELISQPVRRIGGRLPEPSRDQKFALECWVESSPYDLAV